MAAASSKIPGSNTVSRRVLSGFIVAALSLVIVSSASAQRDRDGDPPSRVARIAWAQGNVSLEPGGTDSFVAAQVNYPLSEGDRVYADLNSLSEVQTSGLAVRLGSGADLTVTALTDSVAQFALAQGSIRVRTRDLFAQPSYEGDQQQAVVEIDTPNATILVQQPGDLRVDTYPQDGTTIVTVNSGAAEVSGQGFDQTIAGNQSIRLTGFDQVYAEYVGILPPDPLDQFDADRERRRERSIGFRNHYVDPEMIGAADLDDYGDWQPAPQYGAVWFPRNVPSGWTPYSVGHWAIVPPWGYTWVDSEPWGFAPFHYGRWNNFGGRWGWVPGPPPTVFAAADFNGRPPRPVYSPALVAFVGGPGFSLSISLGGGGGVTAWFPLGPSEPYVPWYRTSPAYVNRVNVTNIYNTNVTEIHNTYINKTTTVYNVTNVTNVTYVNRNTATVAVAQKDFAAGRSTTQSAPIRLDDNARRQLAQAPVVQHVVPPPPRVIAVAAQAPPKAAPPVAARPVVQTRQGFQRAGAPPAPTPLKPPTPPPPTAASRAALPQPRPVQAIAPAKPSGAAPIVRNGAAQPPLGAKPPAAAPGAAPVVRNPGNPAPAPVVRAPGNPAPAPGQTGVRPAQGSVAAPIQRPVQPPLNQQARPSQPAPARTAPLAQPTPAQPLRTQPVVPVRPAPAATLPPPARPAPGQPVPAQPVKPGTAVVPQQPARTVPQLVPAPRQVPPSKPNPAAQPAPNARPLPPPGKNPPPPADQRTKDQRTQDQRIQDQRIQDQRTKDQPPNDQKPN